jgi:hypothetical protein
MLGFLATGADNAKNLAHLFATVAGISLRGAYYYAHEPAPYRFAGWCRLDWLADFVGASQRTIQRLKERLRRAGWYLPEDAPQWAMNRYGDRFRINPEWDIPKAGETAAVPPAPPTVPPSETARETGEIPAQLSPPPVEISGPTVTPIREESNKESPPEPKNQDNNESQPPAADPKGPDFFKSEPEERKNQDPTPLPRPKLSDIRPELDFVPSGMPRLMELYRQATRCGLIGLAENDRLRWVACAVRAMSQPGVERPAAVFLRLVKGKLFGHLSDADFDEAHRRLKVFGAGQGAPPRPHLVRIGQPTRALAPAPEKPKLSRDAQLVKTVREEFKRRGMTFPVFAALYREGWSRERYSAAIEELGALEGERAACSS